MALFERIENPFGKEVEYTRYREYVRTDFKKLCAYCLLSEILASGQENFELDHFRPKSKFAELTNTYENIYYACHVCNKHKWAHWPDEGLEELEFRFVDFCKENFSDHFSEIDGIWKAHTKAGVYTVERLRLNRDHLISVRNLLNQICMLKTGRPCEWDNPPSEAFLRTIQTY